MKCTRPLFLLFFTMPFLSCQSELSFDGDESFSLEQETQGAQADGDPFIGHKRELYCALNAERLQSPLDNPDTPGNDAMGTAFFWLEGAPAEVPAGGEFKLTYSMAARLDLHAPVGQEYFHMTRILPGTEMLIRMPTNASFIKAEILANNPSWNMAVDHLSVSTNAVTGFEELKVSSKTMLQNTQTWSQDLIFQRIAVTFKAGPAGWFRIFAGGAQATPGGQPQGAELFRTRVALDEKWTSTSLTDTPPPPAETTPDEFLLENSYHCQTLKTSSTNGTTRLFHSQIRPTVLPQVRIHFPLPGMEFGVMPLSAAKYPEFSCLDMVPGFQCLGKVPGFSSSPLAGQFPLNTLEGNHLFTARMVDSYGQDVPFVGSTWVPYHVVSNE